MKTITMMILLSLLPLSVNILAEERAVSDRQSEVQVEGPLNTQAIERWQQLSPEQQQALRDRYQQYQALPAEQQQQLQQNLQRFKAMDRSQQQQIQERYMRWQALSPERREQLRQTYQDFSKLTPEQQQQLREDMSQLQDMPAAERAERAQQLRQNYMGGQHSNGSAGGMPRAPMGRMGH